FRFMRAAARACATAIVLIAVASIRAQMPEAGVRPRAEALLSRVSAGQEAAVPCTEFDESSGKDLLRIAEKAQSHSAILAWRLAQRAGDCAGEDTIVGAALTGLSNALMGRGQFSEALAAAQESVRVHERLQGPGLSRALSGAGNAHWWLNDNRAALDDFQRA